MDRAERDRLRKMAGRCALPWVDDGDNGTWNYATAAARALPILLDDVDRLEHERLESLIVISELLTALLDTQNKLRGWPDAEDAYAAGERAARKTLKGQP